MGARLAMRRDKLDCGVAPYATRGQVVGRSAGARAPASAEAAAAEPLQKFLITRPLAAARVLNERGVLQFVAAEAPGIRPFAILNRQVAPGGEPQKKKRTDAGAHSRIFSRSIMPLSVK